jgi:acyl carrier protein
MKLSYQPNFSVSTKLGLTDSLAGIKLHKFIRKEVFMSDTFEEIKNIIVELLGVDASKITPEARFREDLEADSLDLVEMIMAFEDKFGGEISDEDAQKIITVGDAVKYVQERM